MNNSLVLDEVTQQRTYRMPEVNITPTNPRALDIQQHLSLLQIASPLHHLQTGLRLSHPQLMRRVRVHTNVRLGLLDLGDCRCAHLESVVS
jgi:hypothetical protein